MYIERRAKDNLPSFSLSLDSYRRLRSICYFISDHTNNKSFIFGNVLLAQVENV